MLSHQRGSTDGGGAILDAALDRLEAFGPRRTTIDDVARAARVSRVTVYRRFGNRDGLLRAVVLREIERFFDALERAVAPYDDRRERVAEGFAFTLGYVRAHALLGRVLRTEPETLLPYLTGAGGEVVAAARARLAERLWRPLDGAPADEVEVVAELLARLVLSFVTTPQTAARLDTPDDARAFGRRYLVPIVQAAGDPGHERGPREGGVPRASSEKSL